MSATFDVFLSHSFLDASLIDGVRRLLERAQLSVYVDWVQDPELDRAAVTVETAEKLRKRLRNCKSLIFATSSSEGQPLDTRTSIGRDVAQAWPRDKKKFAAAAEIAPEIPYEKLMTIVAAGGAERVVLSELSQNS